MWSSVERGITKTKLGAGRPHPGRAVTGGPWGAVTAISSQDRESPRPGLMPKGRLHEVTIKPCRRWKILPGVNGLPRYPSDPFPIKDHLYLHLQGPLRANCSLLGLTFRTAMQSNYSAMLLTEDKLLSLCISATRDQPVVSSGLAIFTYG